MSGEELGRLILSGNDLTATIPLSFSALTNLTAFYAGTKDLCLPSSLIDWHNTIEARDPINALLPC